jgi:hypothetical protein
MKFLSYCLVISTLFPYTKVLPLATDNQPNSLLLGMSLIFLNTLYSSKVTLKAPIWIALSLIPFFACIFVFLLGDTNFNAVRSLIAYLNVPVLLISLVIALKNLNGLPFRVILFTILVWCFVGLIHKYLDPTFLDFLKNRANEAIGGRGVNSLAPEPSFYGLVCLFLSFLLVFHPDFRRRHWIYVILLLLQIVFLAVSSITIIYIIGYITLKTLVELRLKSALLLTFCLILFIYNVENIFLLVDNLFNSGLDFRLLRLASKLLTSPELLLELDGSINDRFFSIYFSIKGFLNNYGFPNGLNSFRIYREYASSVDGLGQLSWWTSTHHDRINSGLGAPLFELGVFGLVYPFIIYKSVIYRFGKSIKDGIVFTILLTFIMLNAVPISFSYFALFIAYCVHYGRSKRYPT